MTDAALKAFGPPTRENIAALALAFVAYFLVAIFSLYVYFAHHTSPALIWPPVGLAFALMLFGGYRMWIPIFVGQLFATALYLAPTGVNQFVVVVIAAAYATQAVVALYVFERLQFNRSMEYLRDVLILVGGALTLTMIEPAIATLTQTTFETLTVSAATNFGRAWSAGMFSVLVVTPALASWYPLKKFAVSRSHAVEIAAAFLLLTANNVFMFWTDFPKVVGIAIIFFLPAVLIWFALRFHPRWLTLAVLLTSVVGIAGSIVAHPSSTSTLAAQLLADEIYIGLVAAIFYVFVAVVEERRRAYAELKLAYESTSASDKAKNEFIAILAHELRNPLAPIVSSLELLKIEPQSAEALRTIESAEEHAIMIRRLLDDLLDAARLSQKKFKLQKQDVRLRDLIDLSVASSAEYIESRGHTLSVTRPENTVHLYADPVRIKQILINLLNNAAKYTPHGGHISLKTLVHEDEVSIEIADDGIGIADSMLPHLFEPFKQLNDSTSTSSGLGIGLYLTKRLAEMHDGRVEAKSAGPGKGSVFTVTLPIPRQSPLPIDSARPRPLRRQAPRRILVVDDNQPAAVALQRLLTHRGHDVETAFSGKDAVLFVERKQPDVIILDIGMPEIDGYEVARRVRANGWDGTIVAVTGYGQETDRMRSKEAGFDHHLVKPVSVADLESVLGNALSAQPVLA